jgi:hypothetical protein
LHPVAADHSAHGTLDLARDLFDFALKPLAYVAAHDRTSRKRRVRGAQALRRRLRHATCVTDPQDMDFGPTNQGIAMLNLLWPVAVVLVVLWALGFALHITLGGLIHLLLVLAVVSVLRIIMGRRAI